MRVSMLSSIVGGCRKRGFMDGVVRLSGRAVCCRLSIIYLGDGKVGRGGVVKGVTEGTRSRVVTSVER